MNIYKTRYEYYNIKNSLTQQFNSQIVNILQNCKHKSKNIFIKTSLLYTKTKYHITSCDMIF